MKAFVLRSYGSADRLELTELDKPVPADDEVLVRVRATSVNPYDWHHLRGEPRIARLMPGGLGLRRPALSILGCDMAGQVEAVGGSVTGFGPGDDVFALLEQGRAASRTTSQSRHGCWRRNPAPCRTSRPQPCRWPLPLRSSGCVRVVECSPVRRSS